MINPEPLSQSIIDILELGERLQPSLAQMQRAIETAQPAIRAAEQMARDREAELQWWVRWQ